MNLLGKIFTMLIFVMSVVFMSLSLMVYATHKNWKLAAIGVDPSSPGLKMQLDKERIRNQQLQNDIELLKGKLAAEQAARAYALSGLQSNKAVIEEELKGKSEELKVALADLTDKTAALKTSASTQEKLQNEVVALADNIRVAQADRDKIFDKVVSLLDQSHAALDTERTLKERRDQLVEQVASYKYAIQLHGIDVTLVSLNSPPPPNLDGMVLAVNSKDLVEISVGSDDGLKEGHALEVFRGSLYLGKIVVMKVTPNRAVGKVVPEYKRGPIRKDDRVATKLSKLG